MEFITINMPYAVKGIFLYLLFFSTFANSGSCPSPVYLTFDTGNMSTAKHIAQILKQKNVRARFFLANNPTKSGASALSSPWKSYWKSRVNEGHTFGNHTWSHYFVRSDMGTKSIKAYNRKGGVVKLNKKTYCAELTRVQSTFYKLTGHKISGVWRAPAGRTTQNSIRWAAECGYPIHMGWSTAGYIRDDLSSKKYPNKILLDKAATLIHEGDIVLMHLGTWQRKKQAAGILANLIDKLRSRGLCFESLSSKKS